MLAQEPRAQGVIAGWEPWGSAKQLDFGYFVDSFSLCVLHSINPYRNQAVRDYYPNFTGTLTEVKIFVKSHRTSYYLSEN